MIDEYIVRVLTTLQQHKPSIVVGGYLRDTLCGLSPHDVDIATELSISEVKQLFPSLNGTEKGLAFGVGRFTHHQMMFEISTHEHESVLDSLATRDFTMNSLYFDGQQLHDPFGAKQDIAAKQIRSLEPPAIHFTNKPEAYLRAIRFTGQLGFELSDELILFMHQNKAMFQLSTVNRIQQEGYRILQSDYPLKAFQTLTELKFIPRTTTYTASRSIPTLSTKLDIRVAYLASIVGVETMFAFLDLFHLSKRLKEKIHYLIPYFTDDKKVDNPYILNEVVLLKRYQYHHNPDKLKAYLHNLKN